MRPGTAHKKLAVNLSDLNPLAGAGRSTTNVAAPDSSTRDKTRERSGWRRRFVGRL